MMNIVKSGGMYKIYGDSLETYDKLPTGTYEVSFSKLTGFFLTPHANLGVNEDKIYGSCPAKVDKVLRAFGQTDRNFGVILSGRKGIGKSLFAKLLAIKGNEQGIPLVIVPEYIPGIADFLGSIEQEVIVLFDEFEKTFSTRDGFNPQDEMLSLFDGIDGGKKLFVITCNEVNKLSSYLINRPGRFHYHFALGNPTQDEIREYMSDKLEERYHDVIDKLVGLSMSTNVTYDVLRAIAFELNNGYSFEETMEDLNISKEDTPRYDVRATFSNGSTKTERGVRINMYGDEEECFWLYGRPGDANIQVTFDPRDVTPDYSRGVMTINPDCVELWIDESDFDMDNKAEKDAFEKAKSLDLVELSFKKVISKEVCKYMV